MRPYKRLRRGAALAEFAVVMPILLLIFAGIIEIGRMLLLQQTADTAAYEGARHAMVPGATTEEAIDAAQRLLTQSKITNAEIRIDPLEITESTPLISVEVRIPVADNCWFFRRLGSDIDVTSEVTLITERVPLIRLTGMPELKAKSQKGGKVTVDL